VEYTFCKEEGREIKLNLNVQSVKVFIVKDKEKNHYTVNEKVNLDEAQTPQTHQLFHYQILCTFDSAIIE